MKQRIIKAIKNFDIVKLETLLDDETPYMNVPKSLFLEILAKKLELAKSDSCDSFDDVFFGICDSCNMGCEGMTFYSNSGYYLDIFMEGDNESVTDIYVCNKLINFTDLEKLYDLGFSFKKDEEVAFEPDGEYMLISKQYYSLLEDIELIEPNIKLDKLINWYHGYDYIRNFITKPNSFNSLRYKLYGKVFRLIFDVDEILNPKLRAQHAMDALINLQTVKTEREKLICFFENRIDHKAISNFSFPEVLSEPNVTIFRSYTYNIEFTIDISGYEYVFDYFRKLDNLFDYFTDKYKPLPEHFKQSPTGTVEDSLESFLRLHNVHLDVIEKYGDIPY